MPHCPICTKGAAKIPVEVKGRRTHVCPNCAERLKFERMGKEERLAYLKQLDEELSFKESGKKRK